MSMNIMEDPIWRCPHCGATVGDYESVVGWKGYEHDCYMKHLHKKMEVKKKRKQK